MQRCVFSFDSANAVGDNATGVSGSGGGGGGAGVDNSESAFLFLLLVAAAAAPGVTCTGGKGGGAWGAVAPVERTAAVAAVVEEEEREASTLGTGSWRTRFRSVRMRAIMKRFAVPGPPLFAASAFLRTQSGGVELSLSGGSTASGCGGGLTMALMETSGSVGRRSLKRLLSSVVVCRRCCCWSGGTVIFITDGVTSATGTCFDCFVKSNGDDTEADPAAPAAEAATFCMVTEAAPNPLALKLFLGGEGAAARLDMAKRHCAAKMS